MTGRAARHSLRSARYLDNHRRALRRFCLPFWPTTFLAVAAWLIAWFAAAPFAAWFAYDLLGLEASEMGDLAL